MSAGFNADLPGKAAAQRTWQQLGDQAPGGIHELAARLQLPEHVTGNSEVTAALQEFGQQLQALAAPLQQQLQAIEHNLAASADAYQEADQAAADQFHTIEQQRGGQ